MDLTAFTLCKENNVPIVVFDINENMKFKPAFMAKAVKGSPMAMDITANVLINEKLEAGLG